MKKMIVSMMLIISMFAFAAESDPSNTVGYVRYDLDQPGGFLTGLNMLALPFDNGYTDSQQLGQAIPNCNQVSRYNAATQGLVSSAPGPFGWSNLFPVTPGNAYQVNVTANSQFISNGVLVEHPSYDLLQPEGYLTGLNFIMHPLTHNHLIDSQQLGTDIPNCNQVSRYNSATQGWVSSAPGPFGWSNLFPTEIGRGLQVNVTASTQWPSTKDHQVEEVFAESFNLETKTPKNVMYLVVDEFDNYFDFSAAPYDNITYRGWMTLRPGEVLNQASAGSFYETFGAGMSFVAINIGNFPTPWSAGETVTFRVQQVQDATLPPEDHFPVLDDSIETSELDGTVDDFYGGAGTILGDPWYGDPLALQTPSSIESNLPSVTRLHQNYPNPFNPTTTIRFDLSNDSNVRLNVYNYNGQLVRSLVNGPMSAGYHTVNFDAASLSAGVYYYTMEAAGRTMTQKMVLVK